MDASSPHPLKPRQPHRPTRPLRRRGRQSASSNRSRAPKQESAAAECYHPAARSSIFIRRRRHSRPLPFRRRRWRGARSTPEALRRTRRSAPWRSPPSPVSMIATACATAPMAASPSASLRATFASTPGTGRDASADTSAAATACRRARLPLTRRGGSALRGVPATSSDIGPERQTSIDGLAPVKDEHTCRS